MQAEEEFHSFVSFSTPALNKACCAIRRFKLASALLVCVCVALKCESACDSKLLRAKLPTNIICIIGFTLVCGGSLSF